MNSSGSNTPDMNGHDPIAARLKKAFPSSSGATADEYGLDTDALSARKVSVRSPKTRGIVAGSGVALAGVAALALVTTSVLTPPAPLFTLASGGGQGVASTEALAASDAKMMMWVQYLYTPDESLSREPGRGPVYELRLSGTAESVLADVAEAFGVSGEVQETEYFDPSYPSYIVGPEDWSEPNVMITWSGTGSWWYSNPTITFPDPICQMVGEGDEAYEECVPGIPDAPVPSEDEALAQTLEIFRSIGMTVNPDQLRVAWADEWGITVSMPLVVGGTETALEWVVSFAPGGAVSYASGHSIEVINRGEFDTVSAYDAVSRIEEGVWWGAPGPQFFQDMPMEALARSAAEPGVATEDATVTDEGSATDGESPAVEPVEPVEPGTTEPGTTDGSEEPAPPVIEPEPIEPGVVEPGVVEPEVMPVPEEPDVIDAVITDATSTLLLVWDQSGGAWLVPGFVMTPSEGWWVSVISLVEGIIDLPDPADYGIMPLQEPAVEEGVTD